VCVQVWVVCLSADGRTYSGGWLQCVFVLILALVFMVVCLYVVGGRLSLFIFYKFLIFHHVCLFSFSAILLRCDASCLTCVGPSQGNCSSCSSSHSLQEGVCVVNTVCTDGQSTVSLFYYMFAHYCWTIIMQSWHIKFSPHQYI